jgi:hypothetical protein
MVRSAAMPRLRLTPEKDPRYPLDRRLDGPESWSEYRRQSKNSLPVSEIEPRSFIL